MTAARECCDTQPGQHHACTKRASRGTSNSDSRGSSIGRRRRRQWLVREFPADVVRVVVTSTSGVTRLHVAPEQAASLSAYAFQNLPDVESVLEQPVCGCYRCGTLLDEDEVSPDRWPILGADGGRYVQGNIRPACSACQSSTGGKVGATRKATKARPRRK